MEPTSKRILLFGGTFDPIHNGHLAIARAAARQLGADKVILIPSAQPPHKDSGQISDARHRLRMSELAVKGDELFEVSDCELRREGLSFTLETVRYFREVYETETQLYWLIGADSLVELVSWYKVRELMAECTIVTAGRSGYAATDMTELSTALGAKQAARLKENILDTPLVDISATEIRRRASEGQSIVELVPEAVAKYIEQKGLYRS